MRLNTVHTFTCIVLHYILLLKSKSDHTVNIPNRLLRFKYKPFDWIKLYALLSVGGVFFKGKKHVYIFTHIYDIYLVTIHSFIQTHSLTSEQMRLHITKFILLIACRRAVKYHVNVNCKSPFELLNSHRFNDAVVHLIKTLTTWRYWAALNVYHLTESLNRKTGIDWIRHSLALLRVHKSVTQ